MMNDSLENKVKKVIEQVMKSHEITTDQINSCIMKVKVISSNER